MNHVGRKCSMSAIVGATNAGKSTLVNVLVGQKVAAVTPKVQTTRVRMHAVSNHENVQLIFIDTPGIFSPKTKLEKFLVKHAWMSLKGIENVIVLVDVKNYLNQHLKKIIDRIKHSNLNAILVLNKIDIVHQSIVSEVIEYMYSLYKFSKAFTISALYGIGIDKLVDYLCETSPYGPWLYNDDQISDAPLKFFMAEITREKLFITLRHELPYSLSVVTELVEEKEDNSLIIKQVIYVTKGSHKTIILGKKGEMVKKISMESKSDLENILQVKVHLFLFVKVREFWQNHLNECVGYAE
ncbi:GTPase Era [Ehrlichia ruminantium]|uniref:GTPase Era n=1 Tax=Ehrlichia ruminantium (strain Welgevonden) TaxID=254945 RepID=ERA_EHRRW|nr:GTPase Era [Ehrlichia ruminantium]Q5HAY9.1 RecName: Full=GTPase Era [Ehrlichia ruminantium str. Welgevonden]QLK55219.1 GTPase Era [Ehrlichia ruminantium]QLK56136.1 GTPase Era [Ehrlichia ruminantium]UOD99343.1 GTPase Era [Ehrlichia ruminantium]CAH58271.1 putative GTP-binding protein ERA [Ehrlichia ruminantium str. Welgevonden]CAI27062.1 GTP-binding protein Era homolog [Ehrlichia ruminantium str. Welgevonden]